MAKPFLYRCPVTGLNVQGMTSDGRGDVAGEREIVHCLACGGVHLVNPADAPKPLEEEPRVRPKPRGGR